MPKRCETSRLVEPLVATQDGLIHRDQGLSLGFTRRALSAKLRDRHWQLVLPDVYLTNNGIPTYRQRLVAALLYTGPDSAIDAANACYFHGLRSLPQERERVFVVVPDHSSARSRGFVIVRRTTAPIRVERTEYVRYLEAAAAVIAAGRRMTRPRQVLALLSEAVQQRIATYDELLNAHVQGPPKNARSTDDALEQIAAGIRSPSEADFRALAEASTILPTVEYNVWLKLRCGRVVCVDALIASSAVVHETNGRRYHEREDLFGDMQERHDALTASGLVALHNQPVKILRRGREVISQVERTHLIYEGRGMPGGVVRLPGPPDRLSAA